MHQKQQQMKNKEYYPNPLDLTDIELPDVLKQLTEAIAENVHEVWAAGRIKEGWKYGAERNDKLKTHPCLIPYSELPESEKKYDRETAINTIRLILKLGYKISD